MNLRKDVIVVALAALVAGAAALVYALSDGASHRAHAQDAAKQAADDTEILYDAASLPQPVQRILRAIILAAQTGDIEAMRPVLESNELKPMVAAKHVDDPIAYWREQSVDGSGRDVLAAMLNMLDTGFVLTGKDHDAMYVWPYFAEVDIGTLSPQQQVQFFRAVPPSLAKTMKEKGEYSYYSLGISPSGVWHYFIR